MSNSTGRKVAIIGAGLAGTTAGLGLRNAGFDVTIYSDRDRASLRNDVPPTGTAVYFGKSLDYDAEIIENLYDIGNQQRYECSYFLRRRRSPNSGARV